jgi:hypothetical protein
MAGYVLIYKTDPGASSMHLRLLPQVPATEGNPPGWFGSAAIIL